MIFLNSLLALGALAFTVPLAIHLLFRNRFEVIDWGAMRFLESVVRVNRRRLQLRNLLLLLVRCAIPILLAFCLARPVMTGWQTLPGDEPVSMVLALDTSDSLALKVDENSTRFSKLITTAEQIVASLPRGSDVSLVTSASLGQSENRNGSAAASATDSQSVLTALRAIRMGGTSMSLEGMLSESLRRISSGATERRHIVVLTDDSAGDFLKQQMDLLEPIKERVNAQKPIPSIVWIDAWPSQAVPGNNRRISRLEPSQSASVPGQSIVWEVEARVDGDAATTATLDIRVDGTSLESKTLAFRSGLARASFATVFETAGRHAVEVSLPSEDSFAPDDRLRSDFVTLPPIEVWLVDGNSSDKPLMSDTDYLAIALSPFSLSGSKAVDLFQTTRVSDKAIGKKSEDDRDPKMVVLADVGVLSDSSRIWLSNFVENEGGNLVIFAGPATDDNAWGEKWVDSKGAPMLPMRWGDIKAVKEGDSGWKIDESRLTYPPLAVFSREAKGTLNSVDVSSLRAMLPHEPSTNRSAGNANVILRLEDGSPLIAVADAGKGKIMQVATTANDRWTSLPRRLAFVPLIQRLFMHLAIGESNVNTATSGESIKIDKSQLSSLPEPAIGKWSVATPLGKTIPLEPVEGDLNFSETDAAGIYRFDFDGKAMAFAAVNVPETETKLARVETAVRDEASKRISATRYASLAEYQSDDSTRRFGRGVWRYLLLALLAAMIVEPFLQQRGARAV